MNIKIVSVSRIRVGEGVICIIPKHKGDKKKPLTHPKKVDDRHQAFEQKQEEQKRSYKHHEKGSLATGGIKKAGWK